jgi:hypothetical protein
MEGARTLVGGLLYRHVAEPVYAAPAIWETKCKLKKLTSSMEVEMPINAQLETTAFLSELVLQLLQTTCYCNDLLYVTPDTLIIGLGVRQDTQRRHRATKRKFSSTDDIVTTTTQSKRARPSLPSAAAAAPTTLLLSALIEDKRDSNPLELVATELTLLLANLRKDRTPKEARIRHTTSEHTLTLEVQQMDYFSLAELSRIATRLRLCAAELESLPQFRFHKLTYGATVGFYHDHLGLKLHLHAQPTLPTASTTVAVTASEQSIVPDSATANNNNKVIVV